MANVQIVSMKAKHHAIIDRLIVEPTIKLSHLAAEIGVTQPWLSVVMQSDIFKEEYAKRRAEHNAGVRERIIDKQLKITEKALNKLDDILDSDDVEDRLVLDTAERTSKLLGFSPSQGNAPQLTAEETERLVVREVAPGVIERARERIRRVTTTDPKVALPSAEG